MNYNPDITTLYILVILFVGLYIMSRQIQKYGAQIIKTSKKRLGVFTNKSEYAIQRYVYQNRNSIFSRIYMWVNTQLIALGYKSLGVTPLGYLLFWGFISLIISAVVGVVIRGSITVSLVLFVVVYICLMVFTRVSVSGIMEAREMEIMDAIDLIVPELEYGVKNAIKKYENNFAPSIRVEFKTFLTNVNDRGYSFNDAMHMLADNLGLLFYDFAQKAIFYEAVGEADMQDIFSDITETNRIRRELRDKNNIKFTELQTAFVASTFMTGGYFLFLIATDEFSRTFFLKTDTGFYLLLAMIITVFGVLSYIVTIKSRAL